MVGFEYTSAVYTPVVTIDDLNTMGALGWEFCFKRTRYDDFNRNTEIVVFKRKKYD